MSRIEDETPTIIQDTDFTPTILEFPTEGALNDFVSEHKLELTTFNNAHGRQKLMLQLEEFNSDTGGRTLAELHGLDKNDPWDRRTDEEKAEAEEQRKKMQKKRKSGDITEDSWGGGATRIARS